VTYWKEQRSSPYLWVTWLTALVAGDSHCVWASWFKARFKYQKLPESNPGKLAQWTSDHNEALMLRVESLRADGWAVTIEDQNSFRGGSAITLSGKADILAIRGEEARVEDIKTGRRSNSDYWQVLTYMWMLPKMKAMRSRLAGKRLSGAVVYSKTGEFWEINPDELNDVSIGRIVKWVKRMQSDEDPPKVPSQRECQWCNITECDARWAGSPDDAVAEVGNF
jgi:CRISPR/Cas system-associated exonuclease Cas4 (RecB family)